MRRNKDLRYVPSSEPAEASSFIRIDRLGIGQSWSLQAHAAAQGRGSEVKGTARPDADSVSVLEGERARAR